MSDIFCPYCDAEFQSSDDLLEHHKTWHREEFISDFQDDGYSSGSRYSSGRGYSPKPRLPAKQVAILAGVMVVIFFIISVAPNISIPTTEPAIPTTNNLKVIKTLPINEEGGRPSDGWIQRTLDEKTVIKSNSDGTIKFQYFVPKDHCGDVKVHVVLDGKEASQTRWMGNYQNNPNIPLTSGIIAFNLEPNKNYSIAFYPEGRPGGCGDGYVYSWFGTVEFYQ